MASGWFNTAHAFSTIILGNWEIKLVAFFLAVLVWLYVVTEGTYYEQVTVPIAVEDIPDGMILANTPPSEARISIHGQGRELLRLKQADCRVIIKVGNRQRERRSYSLSKVNVEAPAGIDVQEVIAPKTLDVELDVPFERELRVVNRVTVKPDDGYMQVGKVTIRPAVVTVKGPRDVVRKMETIPTDSIVLAGVKKAASTKVKIRIPPEINLKVTPSEVVVEADIQEISERWIHGVRVGITHVPSGKRLRVDPEIVEVKVKGRTDLIESVESKDFSASADYRQWKNGRSRRVQVKLSGPPGVRWVEVRPKTVMITD